MNIEEQTASDANNYHEVMDALRRLELPHGRCLPREAKACTHCAAAEKIVQMKADYKDRSIRFA